MFWKPLVRWTIGKPSQIGLDILKLSIDNLIKIYEDYFDYVICYNNLSANDLRIIKSFNIPLFNSANINVVGMKNKAWKLVPPRLRPDGYEIILDNDLIIDRKLPILEDFLAGDFILVTEGVAQTYGKFHHVLRKSGLKINTGLVGLPPKFDLSKEIDSVKQIFPKIDISDGFNEQGLLAWIISDSKHRIIPLAHISIAEPTSPLILGEYGVHFVGANTDDHTGWLEYLNESRNLSKSGDTL